MNFCKWDADALIAEQKLQQIQENTLPTKGSANLGDFHKKRNIMIQKKLEEADKNLFSQYGIHLDVLKNCPQTIPTLAEWLYETWHPYDASLTKEKLIHSFETRLNTDKIPITFVALKDNLPVGLVSLKNQTSPELSDFSEDTLWMGGLQVVPEQRNQGLGQELLKFAADVAKSFGYEKLHFYTSDPSKVHWYLKRGAQLIETRTFRDHTITIMCISLKAFPHLYSNTH